MAQIFGSFLPSPLRLVGACLLTAVLLLSGSYAQADTTYPLEPVDTSSPRATLTSFLGEIEDTWRLFRDEYWDAPSYEIYTRIINKAARVLRTMDLSQVAPSARNEDYLMPVDPTMVITPRGIARVGSKEDNAVKWKSRYGNVCMFAKNQFPTKANPQQHSIR